MAAADVKAKPAAQAGAMLSGRWTVVDQTVLKAMRVASKAEKSLARPSWAGQEGAVKDVTVQATSADR